MTWDDPEAEEAAAAEAARAELVLAQTTALLHQRGDEQAVALLVDVDHATITRNDDVIRRVDFFGADMPEYGKTVWLDVADHIVARFTGDVRARITGALSYVAERNGFPDVTQVHMRPALPDVPEDWRETYSARLDLDRPTNQARRERGLPGHPVEDDLTFGSAVEVLVYRALRKLQTGMPEDRTIAIMALPGVRLRAGHTWTPDLVVVGNGRAVVIEVDGPHHASPRRYSSDQNQDLQWRRCGVTVVRLNVEDVKDEQALDARLREELRRALWP